MIEVVAQLQAGDVAAALAQAQAAVRAQPAEVSHRVALGQIQMLLGLWEKAKNQLEVVESMDVARLPFTRTCLAAMQCEQLREAVYEGERGPLVAGEPPVWLAKLIQANRQLVGGEVVASAALRQEAFEEAPASVGTIDGNSFSWLADMDSRLGPVFELFVDGKYYWAPVDRVKLLKFSAPEEVRDLIWMPVEVTWSSGGDKMALMPTRYPGSERSLDSQIVLARRTEWTAAGEETFLGLGQRTFCSDVGEHGALDVREVMIESES